MKKGNLPNTGKKMTTVNQLVRSLEKFASVTSSLIAGERKRHVRMGERRTFEELSIKAGQKRNK